LNSVDSSKTTATFDTNKYKYDSGGIITHIISENVLSSTLQNSFVTVKFEDLEDGASAEYRLRRVEDTGLDGTLSNPESFSDPDNAFDSDDVTYSEKTFSSTLTDTATLGKTFSSTNIEQIKVKCEWTTNSATTKTVTLQGYDGSTWSDLETIYDGLTDGSSDNTYNIDSSYEGIRVKFTFTSGSARTGYWRVYILNSITDVESQSYASINQINNGTSFTGAPNRLDIKLIPKTTSPTAGYPSINGVGCIGDRPWMKNIMLN